MNVYGKLMQVQTKLKAPKGQFNSFGKYKYRSCEDILESLKPLLAEVKAILTLTDTIEQIGDRVYIKATATFIDIDLGEKVEVSALAREDETKKGMDLAQVTGSVSSYARKYALNGLFCIDDTKDSDATNTHDKKEQPKSEVNQTIETITENQAKRLFALSKGNVKVVKEVLLKRGYTESKEIPKGKVYDDICKEIEESIKVS